VPSIATGHLTVRCSRRARLLRKPEGFSYCAPRLRRTSLRCAYRAGRSRLSSALDVTWHQMNVIVLASCLVLFACAKEASLPERHSSLPRGELAISALQDSLGCDLDTAARHSDPHVLLQEWIERDNTGDGIHPHHWHFGALTCPDVGASDLIFITSPMTIGNVTRVADTVVALVQYQRYRSIGYDSTGRKRLTGMREERSDSARLIHLGRFGWRIAQIPYGIHLLPRTALDSLSDLDSSAAIELRRLTSRP
jgi:hypothetical protein